MVVPLTRLPAWVPHTPMEYSSQPIVKTSLTWAGGLLHAGLADLPHGSTLAAAHQVSWHVGGEGRQQHAFQLLSCLHDAVLCSQQCPAAC
jgi:hypothetical protein